MIVWRIRKKIIRTVLKLLCTAVVRSRIAYLQVHYRLFFKLSVFYCMFLIMFVIVLGFDQGF